MTFVQALPQCYLKYNFTFMSLSPLGPDANGGWSSLERMGRYEEDIRRQADMTRLDINLVEN